MTLRIRLTSVPVDDQERARRFYTEVLGFVVKHEVPVSEEARWLTVVSPEGPDDLELLLEPVAFPPAREYQRALKEAGIPALALATDDLEADVARLRERGAEFVSGPTDVGTAVIAVLDDTCGNLVQLYQEKQ